MAYIHRSARKHWFILVCQRRRLIGGIIFNILDSRIEKYICLEMIPIRIHRIRIDMPWMPFRIRQNDEDPTGSGFTTLTFITLSPAAPLPPSF